MTYQTNIHIKEEPSSPPCTDLLGHPSAASTTTGTTSTTNIEHQHFSGSVLTYGRTPSGAPTFVGGFSAMFPAQQQSPVTPPYDVSGEDFKWPIGGQETPANPKSCLKETILNRRRARGEGDLENLFEEPKQYKLTKADLERRERRREQNRRAARRCRNKKKIVQTIVCKESEKIGKENEQLRMEIAGLKDEIGRLQGFIESHRRVCQFPETFNIPRYLFNDDASQQEATGTPPVITTSVTDAISHAHQTLGDEEVVVGGGFALPVSISGGQDMGVACQVYASSSSGHSEKPNVNLPSWDLMNLTSDLPQESYFAEFGGAFASNSSSADGYATFAANHAPVSYTSVASSGSSHEMAEMTCVDPNLVQQQKKLPPFHSILAPSQNFSTDDHRVSPGRQDVRTAPPPYATYATATAASGGHQSSHPACGAATQGFQPNNHTMEYTCIDPYSQAGENYLNYFNNPGEFSKRVTM